MAIKRTDDEIKSEIQKLARLRRAVRLSSACGRREQNLHDAIDNAIQELEHGVDTTCEEFLNLPNIVKDTVTEAREWAQGASHSPAHGFGKLISVEK